MWSRSVYIALASVIGLSACSTRPIPQDVTRHGTYQIAQRVRCEFRESLKDLVGRVLVSRGHDDIARSLADGSLRYDVFLKDKVPKLEKRAKDMIERYKSGAIGYDFDFDITEDNNLSGGLGFLDTFTRGTLTLGVSAKNDRKRQDKRNFRLTDSFQSLLTMPAMERICSRQDVDVKSVNPVYPIDGSLNLAESLETFINLTQSGNLIGPLGAPKIPTFADTITFTTTLSGTVAPKLVLKPLGSGLELTGAELSATKARSDVHKLVVALSLPTAGAVTVAEQRALEELAQRAALDEIERQRVKSIDTDTETIRRLLLQR